MAKLIDFKKTYKSFYSPKPKLPELIMPPSMQFVMVDGIGDPNTSKMFADAIGALYSTAYGIKFSRKKAAQDTFTVGALEGLWWNEKVNSFEMGQKKDWSWTLMIWLPDFVDVNEVETIAKQANAKKPNPMLAKLRLETFNEGQSVQIMHVGPYDEEEYSIKYMLDFMAEHGLAQRGKHHEIYLGDPRRADPSKLRTIIRHPVEPKQ